MAKTVEANVPRKARSQMGEVWHQFRRNKGAMVGSAWDGISFSAYFMEQDFHAPWDWWLLPLVW